jgi:hypothetical protein
MTSIADITTPAGRCGSIGPDYHGRPVCEQPWGHTGCCSYEHTPGKSQSHAEASDYKWNDPAAQARADHAGVTERIAQWTGAICGITTANGRYVCTEPSGHQTPHRCQRDPGDGYRVVFRFPAEPDSRNIAAIRAADEHIAAVRAGVREPIIPRAAA